MTTAATPLHDPERLALLRELSLDEPLPDADFERVARLARRMLGVPVTLVSMVQPGRQVFVGASGLTGRLASERATPLSHSYCRFAVESGEPLVVDDAREHPLTRGNPAIAEHDAIAYAGVPIAPAGGPPLGTMCAIDHRPHRWTQWELDVLRDLAALATTEIELRMATRVARHEAAEHFRATFEQATVGMAHVATDGRLLRVNECFTRITGYAADELLGMRLQDLEAGPGAVPDGPEAAPRPVGGEDAHAFRYTLRWRHRAGRIEWVDLTLSSVYDVEGRTKYLLAVVDDVTRQRLARQRLGAQYAASIVLATTASEKEAVPSLLRALVTELWWDFGGLWYVDEQADRLCCALTWSAQPQVLAAFEAATRRRTLDRGEGLPGAVWAAEAPRWVSPVGGEPAGAGETALVRERARAAVAAGLRTALAVPVRAEGTVAGVLEIYSADPRAPDEDLVHTLESVAQQLGQFMTLRRAEERGRRSSQQFTAVFERAAVGIALVAPDGRILDANPAYRQMLDREVRGLCLRDLVHPDDVAASDEMFARLVSRQVDRFSIEERCLRGDGGIVWGRVTASLITGADGTPRFVLCMKEDITARKEAEAALTQRESELRQAQKMEAVGRLAGGVAHDFNNLLTVITAYGGMALSELDPASEVHADVQEIVKAGERATSLTRQLLALSRRQVIEPQLLDTSAVVADAEGMIRRLIGADIEVRTELEPAPWPILADRGQLEQVVLNLVVNARDAMPEGGRLSIVTKNVEIGEAYASRHEGLAPGPHLMLAVSDTGHGMDRETQARVFEPFFTTKPEGKGTGLGLSTVYGIVKQCGGYIWLYSEPTQGTSFKIYFPRAREGGGAPAPAAPEGGALHGTETILLAEDEEPVRTLAARILRRYGYTVLQVASAVEAFNTAVAHQGRIDLVLTDVVMPGMNGRQVVERLVGMRPGIRVLYMSGHTAGEISERGLAPEGVSFLQKPFTPEALARKVRAILDTPAAAPPQRVQRLVIAVVDDVATNRLLLRGVLARRYDVTEYDSGAAALEGFERSLPDVVLLDIGMPGLDGVDVVRRIRSDARLRALPVIAMTGHEMAGDRERFLAAGFTEFMTKPVTDEEALARVIEASVRRPPPG